MNPLLKSIFSTEFGFAILRVTTPILLPALGVAISGLSGAVNIALEGIMLASACAGVLVSAFTHSLLLALLAGIAVGVGMAALLGYFHIKLKADIILAAIALNMFATGITIVFLFLTTGDKGSTSSLTSQVFPVLHIPLLKSIPVLGPILSGHNVLVYAALLAVLLYWLITFKTPLGLRIRAVGQNPDAARSVGINVNRTRMWALLLSGFFGALGGLYLCLGYVSWFGRNITAGRGWIAVAAASLGKQHARGHLPVLAAVRGGERAGQLPGPAGRALGVHPDDPLPGRRGGPGRVFRAGDAQARRKIREPGSGGAA